MAANDGAIYFSVELDQKEAEKELKQLGAAVKKLEKQRTACPAVRCRFIVWG